ncbi:MAG: NAD(+)/NADH kinase [Thermomicrobiales bacterium]|nr:NAD(+)/NADH kinase [Thermomicrobiales bacterium]
MTAAPLVGIIANPASGKDIRRLIALGSSIDNNEKINIVRRMLAGLDALGVAAVAYMPDTYGIVQRAAAAMTLRLDVSPLPMACIGVPGDSEEAARRLADMDAAVILTLGGDGTNRVVARGCGATPLVAVSTGTNNVFPRLVEGTLAGLAAAAVAIGAAPEATIRRQPCLAIAIDGERRDLALIDAVTTRQGWIGARAVWRPDDIREVVLSRVPSAAIGLASLGAVLLPEARGGDTGAYIVVDQIAPHRVLAPLAPGVLSEIGIASARTLAPGDEVILRPGPCTIALDGEREIELLDDRAAATVTLVPDGPRLVDIDAAVNAAAAAGVFRVA